MVGLHRLRRLRDRARVEPAEIDALRTAASLIAAAIERERSEAALREHEQKLRAVFDTALDAIFITDDDRRYVDVNPAACDYLGVCQARPDRPQVDAFLPPQQARTVEADWAEYIAGGPVREEWETQSLTAPSWSPRRPPDRTSSRAAHRVPARHHRAEAARGGAPERAEAREPRPARRRHRARLQQPPDRHHRLRVAAARARDRRRRARAATSARSSARPTGRRS